MDGQARYPQDETHVQAAKPETTEQAWLPGAHEHQGRTRDPEPPPPSRTEGTGRALRLQEPSLTEPTAREHERLPRAARIRRSSDIRSVLRRGIRTRRPALDVYLLHPPGAEAAGRTPRPRVGWIVPKLGHRIVERNRLKRRLREVARRRVLKRLRQARCPADVLVRARRKGYQATYEKLERQWMSVVEAACPPRD